MQIETAPSLLTVALALRDDTTIFDRVVDLLKSLQPFIARLPEDSILRRQYTAVLLVILVLSFLRVLAHFCSLLFIDCVLVLQESLFMAIDRDHRLPKLMQLNLSDVMKLQSGHDVGLDLWCFCLPVAFVGSRLLLCVAEMVQMQSDGLCRAQAQTVGRQAAVAAAPPAGQGEALARCKPSLLSVCFCEYAYSYVSRALLCSSITSATWTLC